MSHYDDKVKYCNSIKSKILFQKFCLEDLDIYYLNLFPIMLIILKFGTLNTPVALTVTRKTYKDTLNMRPSSCGVGSLVIISTRTRLY